MRRSHGGRLSPTLWLQRGRLPCMRAVSGATGLVEVVRGGTRLPDLQNQGCLTLVSGALVLASIAPAAVASGLLFLAGYPVPARWRW